LDAGRPDIRLALSAAVWIWPQLQQPHETSLVPLTGNAFLQIFLSNAKYLSHAIYSATDISLKVSAILSLSFVIGNACKF